MTAGPAHDRPLPGVEQGGHDDAGGQPPAGCDQDPRPRRHAATLPADDNRKTEMIMILYRNNNPLLEWEAEPVTLAEQFWASEHGKRLLERAADPNRDTAGTVALWLHSVQGHGSSWDDRDGFNELVAAVRASWPLGVSS